ncbi:MAG: FAD-binding oxidoreductase [Alphaproteobacteria bacterium]
MTTLPSDFLKALAATVDASALRAGNVTETLDPGFDKANLDADVVVFPKSTTQVAAIVGLCSEHGVALVPQGGRTGLAGGAQSRPGQVVIDMTRMNRMLDLDTQGGTVLVEAGVVLSAVQAAAGEHALATGIDLAARDSATIGGMISTNAGGIEAFRYGTMRQRVLGMEVVLADGTVLSDLKRVVKANEGYDLKQLLIGAEGTLGVVTSAVLALVPEDRDAVTALVSCPRADDALKIFRRLHGTPKGTLLACEIMWPTYARMTAAGLKLDNVVGFAPADDLFLLVEFAASDVQAGQIVLEELLADALEAEEASDAVIAKSGEERRRIWQIREDSFEADKVLPHGFWYDISVPHAHMQTYTDDLFSRMAAIDPALVVLMFGHLGDGNLHLTITRGTPMPELHDAVDHAMFDGLQAIGGSFSAEHGVGLEKRSHLARLGQPEMLDTMRAVKQVLDPKGIMNPGKVL